MIASVSTKPEPVTALSKASMKNCTPPCMHACVCCVCHGVHVCVCVGGGVDEKSQDISIIFYEHVHNNEIFNIVILQAKHLLSW